VANQTNKPFVEELPRLLQARGLSLRALARAASVSEGHLSRVLRRAEYKTVSGELAGRIAEALGLPKDYFPEYRERYVIEKVRADRRLRDELYERLTGR
jgi:transcriptional regulator with XRE-family HTH domain